MLKEVVVEYLKTCYYPADVYIEKNHLHRLEILHLFVFCLSRYLFYLARYKHGRTPYMSDQPIARRFLKPKTTHVRYGVTPEVYSNVVAQFVDSPPPFIVADHFSLLCKYGLPSSLDL